MVVGLILLTAFAVQRFLESALRQMRAEASSVATLELRVAAHSALQVALATLNELNELDSGLYSPSQGWGEPLEYVGQSLALPDGMALRIRISDEGGKIGLNEPDRNQLLLLLNQMGVALWDSDTLIDSLMDWIDDDNDARLKGGEEEDYIRLGLSRLPANEPLRSYDEFRYIKDWRDLLFDGSGRPNSNYALLVATTSLAQRGGRSINLNSAPAAVRYLLEEQSGLDAGKLEDHLAGNDGRLGTADDAFVRNAGELGLAAVQAPTGTGFEPGVLRLELEVSRGPRRLQLNVLLEQGGGSGAGTAGGGGSSQAPGGPAAPGGGQGAAAGRGQNAANASATLGSLGRFSVVEYSENMSIE